MANYSVPLGAPDRAIDHFSGGWVALGVPRTVGTIYTSGARGLFTAALLTPAGVPAEVVLEVRNTSGAFTRIAYYRHDLALAPVRLSGFIPPNTDYRWNNLLGTWTSSAPHECEL